MLRGLRIHTFLSLVLLLLTSAGVQAQAYGRVTVVVKDEQGKPLQGVKVSVTCKDLAKYREETTTNKKGRATVSFTDATRVYDFHFEYEDFQPADLAIKPTIRDSITKEVVLSEGKVVTVGEGPDETTVVFSPAERVFNEGVTSLKGGDMAAAKAKFLEALEKNDKMAPAHAALAGVYLEEKDYEAALASTQRYLELEPGDPNGLFTLYDVYVGMGNQKEADATLKKLKEADRGGDTVALIYNAGVAAVKNGNYAAAKARFQEALEMDPNLGAALGAMALILAKDKSWTEAAKYAERHLALDPGHQRSLRVRWDAYRELGDEAKTAEAFRALAAADPQVLAVEFYNQGVQAFESGNSADAIGHFQHVLEIDPDHAQAHYQVGICYIGTGQTEEARTHLERFLELAPEHPEAPVAKDMLASLN